MKKRLFFTGPIGCGKSTAIRRALADRLPLCGGFLTCRHREPHLYFTLESPDGSFVRTFLDFSAGKPAVELSAFSEAFLRGKVLVLDEIGGVELLNENFLTELEQVLASDVPILGVWKGEDPANKLVQTLGLTERYTRAAERIRKRLQNDPDTELYPCGQFDENARILAEKWVKEYLP